MSRPSLENSIGTTHVGRMGGTAVRKVAMRDRAGPVHQAREAGLCPVGNGHPTHSSPASIRKDSSAC